jgi:ABC-2 type transport system ATP-binding protein
VPTDGSVASLRALLDRLDGVAVDGIAMHAPDLDDVFLSLTGHHTEAEAMK